MLWHKGEIDMKKMVLGILIIGVIVAGCAGVWLYLSRSIESSEQASVSKRDTTNPEIAFNFDETLLEKAGTQSPIRIAVTVTDNTSIRSVEFLLNDQVIGTASEPPYELLLDTSELSEGSYRLQAVAYDTSGNSAESEIIEFDIGANSKPPVKKKQGSGASDASIVSQAEYGNGSQLAVSEFVVSTTSSDNKTPVTVVHPKPSLLVSTAGPVALVENGGAESIAVRLATKPTAKVVVDTATSDSTVITASPSRLTFTPNNWAIPQYVSVNPVNNASVDGSRSARMTLKVDAGRSAVEYKKVLTRTIIINVTDDDTAPVATRAAGGWWAELPQSMQACTVQTHLTGQTIAPEGSVLVPAGDNSDVNFNQDDTVFWFAPGVHTLGDTAYSQVIPGNRSQYVGAPGAIIDGQRTNRYAFGGTAADVRVAYLEIRNFGRGNDNNNEGVINHDAGSNWLMEYLYAHDNDGAAIFIGSGNTLSDSCVRDNGQYGFSMFKPPVPGDAAIKNIVITNNEISGNNTDDWEAQSPGCGCSGGGKFWDVKGASITNNYVHHNKGTGLWADTNNIDFLFDSNWIEGNDGEGIWYEISYNATISRNVLKANAWVKGQANTGSPAPAIYLSESGGESRLQSSVSGSTNLEVRNNLIEDNFSGVTIYENSNRFCNSNGNTSKTYCTPFVEPNQISEPYNDTYPNPINSSHPCYTDIASAPFTTDCRWHAKNIKVFENEFRFDKASVPCAGSYCGAQSLLATGADNIPWAPAEYAIAAVQDKVLFNSGNNFYNNDYFGEWKFTKAYGESISRYGWQAGPYDQDIGSTFTGGAEVGNQLNNDTSTLEASIGAWSPWFGAAVTRTTETAHSGSASLKIDVESLPWGANLNNYPGFDSWPGEHRISYWARKANTTDAVEKMVLLVDWKNSDGSNIKAESDRVDINVLTADWQYAEATLTAPEGAAYVFLSLAGNTGTSGDTVYIDDIDVRYVAP